MSRFTWRAAGGMSNWSWITDEERSPLHNGASNYNFHLRDARTVRNKSLYATSWTRSRFSGGTSTVVGQDVAAASGLYEPMWACDGGSCRFYFIRGVCKDGSAVPLGGAVVELFLTADNSFVSRVSTDGSGNYAAPTMNIGQTHFAVANYGPNTLVGSTVNTLTPSL